MPIGLSHLTTLRPSSSSLPYPSLSTSLSFPLVFPSIGRVAHRPLTTPSLSTPFPWSVVPTEPPDLPCFTSLCQVHTEEGNCLRRWPGASKRPSQAGGEVPPPNGSWWALGCPLARSFPRRGHTTTFRLQIPALGPSFGERNTNSLPSPSCHESFLQKKLYITKLALQRTVIQSMAKVIAVKVTLGSPPSNSIRSRSPWRSRACGWEWRRHSLWGSGCVRRGGTRGRGRGGRARVRNRAWG